MYPRVSPMFDGMTQTQLALDDVIGRMGHVPFIRLSHPVDGCEKRTMPCTCALYKTPPSNDILELTLINFVWIELKISSLSLERQM
jgi:hypothetical protein